MNEVTTRLATNAPSDVDAINRLLVQFRQEFGYETTKAPPDLSGAYKVLLAESGGEVLGLLAAQRCNQLARGTQFLLLTDIYVAPQGRRQGVAKRLMTAVREMAPEIGCAGVSLMVSEVNIPALTTAARAGFTRHDQLLFTYSED